MTADIIDEKTRTHLVLNGVKRLEFTPYGSIDFFHANNRTSSVYPHGTDKYYVEVTPERCSD